MPPDDVQPKYEWVRLTERDLPDLMALKKAAGWNQTAEDWLRMLRYPGIRAQGFRSDGQVIASCFTLPYGPSLRWIAMMLVGHEHRGQGLGTALMQDSLGAEPLAVHMLDATPDGRRLYTKLGFEDQSNLTRLLLSSPKPSRGQDAIECRSMELGDLQEVIRWDAEIFAADRSCLLRDLVATPEIVGKVALDKGQIIGYCCCRPGTLASQVGPLIARDIDTAKALLARMLETRAVGSVIVDAFDNNDLWHDHLKALGFVAQRPLVRMIHGHGQEAVDYARMFAIAGPGLG